MELRPDPYAPKAPPGQDELPYSDGVPLETQRHFQQMMLLIQTLADGWKNEKDFYVAGNNFVYFSALQTKGKDFRGPDVYVVLDPVKDRIRKSWVVWEEDGKLPDVVIELLSPSTEAIDRGEKKRIYERIWRTRFYVLYDPDTHALEGFELVHGAYAPIVPTDDPRFERGDLPIASLGLALGLRPDDVDPGCGPGPWLRWIDPSGATLPTGRELAARAAAERDAATAERDAATAERDAVTADRDAVTAERDAATAERDAAARHVAELEAELRRMRRE